MLRHLLLALTVLVLRVCGFHSPFVRMSPTIWTKHQFVRPTTIRLAAKAHGDLIVGMNKYSHDAGCCIADRSGKVLFAQAKERISRRKHDGGGLGDLMTYGLESINASPKDVAMVVSNNHHFRVLPFERQLPWHEVRTPRRDQTA